VRWVLPLGASYLWGAGGAGDSEGDLPPPKIEVGAAALRVDDENRLGRAGCRARPPRRLTAGRAGGRRRRRRSAGRATRCPTGGGKCGSCGWIRLARSAPLGTGGTGAGLMVVSVHPRESALVAGVSHTCWRGRAQLLAASDSLGRVTLVDTEDFFALRMWKATPRPRPRCAPHSASMRTRRVRFVRGVGRGVSDSYGGWDEARPISAGAGGEGGGRSIAAPQHGRSAVRAVPRRSERHCSWNRSDTP
jgi:hypothetical protein